MFIKRCEYCHLIYNSEDFPTIILCDQCDGLLTVDPDDDLIHERDFFG